MFHLGLYSDPLNNARSTASERISHTLNELQPDVALTDVRKLFTFTTKTNQIQTPMLFKNLEQIISTSEKSEQLNMQSEESVILLLINLYA